MFENNPRAVLAQYERGLDQHVNHDERYNTP